MAFQIPLNKTHHLPGSNLTAEDHIWAFGLNHVKSSLASHPSIGQHFAAGMLKLDFTKVLPNTEEESAPSNSSDSVRPVPGTTMTEPASHPDHHDHALVKPFASHERLVIGHGLLVTLGFLVLLPMGSLIARWSRTFTPKWFKIHRALNFYVALPVIVIGWALGPVAVMNAQASHLFDAHQVLIQIHILLACN